MDALGLDYLFNERLGTAPSLNYGITNLDNSRLAVALRTEDAR
jgi:hypothetical protein